MSDIIKAADILDDEGIRSSLDSVIASLNNFNSALGSSKQALSDFKKGSASIDDIRTGMQSLKTAALDLDTALSNKGTKGVASLSDLFVDLSNNIQIVSKATDKITDTSVSATQYTKNLTSSIKNLNNTFSKLFKNITDTANAMAELKVKGQAINLKFDLSSLGLGLPGTQSSKDTLEAMSVAATELATALVNLGAAQSDEAKEARYLEEVTKRLIMQDDKVRVIFESKIGSYNQLKAELALLKAKYNELGESERATSDIPTKLAEKKAQIHNLLAELKQLELANTAVADKERELAFLQTDEGKTAVQLKKQIKDLKKQYEAELDSQDSELDKLKARLAYVEQNGQEEAELKAQIAAKNREYQETVKIVTELEALERKRQRSEAGAPTAAISSSTGGLEFVEQTDTAANIAFNSDEYNKRIQLNETIKETNRQRVYELQLINSAPGSYKALTAEYELNKIKLMNMSEAERNAADSGKILIERQKELDKILKLGFSNMQGYENQVKSYGNTWNGLSFSIAQVVREFPSMAINAQTFFLAISNNVPIVIDEVNRLIAANKAAAASGQQTQSVGKAIAKGIFNINTLIVAVVTVLSVWGNKIVDVAKDLLGFNARVIDTTKAVKKMHDEFEANTETVAKQAASYYKLSIMWKSLNSESQKVEFVKRYKSEMEQLGWTINDVTDAEKLLAQNTDLVIQALTRRAMAAAAEKLAASEYEKYFKNLSKQEKNERWAYDLAKDVADAQRAGLVRTVGGDLQSVAGTVGATYKRTETKQQVFVRGEWRDLTRVQARISTYATRSAQASKDMAANMASATNYTKLGVEQLKEEDKLTKSINLNYKTKGKSSSDKDPDRDVQDYINRMRLNLQKKHDSILTAIDPDSEQVAINKVYNAYNEMYTELSNMYDKNVRMLAKYSGKMSAEQIEAIQSANAEIEQAYDDLWTKLEFELDKALLDIQLRQLQRTEAAIQLQLEAEVDGSAKSYKERFKLLKVQRDEEIKENNKLTEAERQSEYDINRKWNRQLLDLQMEYMASRRNLMLEAAKAYAEASPQNLEATRNASMLEVSVGLSGELDRFSNLPADQRYDPLEIAKHQTAMAAWRQKSYDAQAKFYEDSLAQKQAADKAEFELTEHNEYAIEKFTLEQERETLQQRLALHKAGIKKLSDEELREVQASLAKNGKDLKTAFLNSIKNQDSLGGILLTALDFDDDSISTFEESKDKIIEYINDILETEIEAAEKEIELQQDKVSAAENAYNAELQARANGYANSVVTAKHELQLQQSTLRKKQAMLAKYQKAQQAIETAQQTSSLVTSVAGIWASCSSLPQPFGAILAGITTAAMFASFAISKVKAAQLTQTYGEGGLEFLEGGSHASGNDIDLHTTNSDGRAMRAEGGEAMAIINKRNTKRYRAILPEIVQSLNSGSFERKFIQPTKGLAMYTSVSNGKADLTKLESGLGTIIKQGRERVVELQDRTIIYKGNVRKTIKHV